MYFYEYGYNEWDESLYITFYHEEIFSQDQFNEIVLECIVSANDVAKKEHDDWVEQEKLNNEIIDPIYHDYEFDASMVYNVVVDMMMSKFGFKKLKIQSHFMTSCCRINYLNDEISSKYKNKEALIVNRLRNVEPRDKKINNIINSDE